MSGDKVNDSIPPRGMVRDPLSAPIPIPESDPERWLMAELAKVIPEELRARETLQLVSPARNPKHIIDAKPEARCDTCHQLCWSSPSTHRPGPSVVFLCWDCVPSHAKPVLELLAREAVR